MQTYSRFPLVLIRGKGATVTDLEGKRYLDCVGGVAVNSFGHCDAEQIGAIQKQVKTLLHVSNLYYNIPQIALAAWLTRHSFARRVFFGNSGAEANEAAIKLARKFYKAIDPSRFEMIAAENSFHGRTLATLAATGQEKYHQGFQPLPEGFRHVPFNDLSAVEKAISPKTAAIFLEPIQGEGGVRIPTLDYLAGIRALCDRYKLLLILDEVQTGMGRTGTLFAYEQSGIVPDILTLAKGLGGGVPIGAMLAKEEVAKAFTPGSHASTFGGNPLACAAAMAIVKRLTPSFLRQVARKGVYLLQRLRALQNRTSAIREVRGIGLLIGIDLLPPASLVIQRAQERGLLLSKTSEQTIRLTPPLTIHRDEMDRCLFILEEILGAKA